MSLPKRFFYSSNIENQVGGLIIAGKFFFVVTTGWKNARTTKNIKYKLAFFLFLVAPKRLKALIQMSEVVFGDI